MNCMSHTAGELAYPGLVSLLWSNIKWTSIVNPCKREGWLFLDLKDGSVGGMGVLNGATSCRLQVTQWWSVDLTRLRPLIIQYFLLIFVRVSFIPLCMTWRWALLTTKVVKWASWGKHSGYLVAYCRSALLSLPRSTIVSEQVKLLLPPLSSFNCAWVSMIHSLSASTNSSGVSGPLGWLTASLNNLAALRTCSNS